MSLANNGLGFFHGPPLLWEHFLLLSWRRAARDFPGPQDTAFLFFLFFVPLRFSVSSFFQLPVFTQITQWCLPITVVLTLSVIFRFAFQAGNLIPQSDRQI